MPKPKYYARCARELLYTLQRGVRESLQAGETVPGSPRGGEGRPSGRPGVPRLPDARPEEDIGRVPEGARGGRQG